MKKRNNQQYKRKKEWAKIVSITVDQKTLKRIQKLNPDNVSKFFCQAANEKIDRDQALNYLKK